MLQPCVLAAAFIACFSAICLGSEVPTLDDPPPFADIPVPVPTKSSPTDDRQVPSIGPVDPAALRRSEQAVRLVNHLGDPELIDFRGVSKVPVEDVRSALRWDPKFQAASRPSNKTSDFLAVLESRVLDGYQSSGFPDAKVSAWRDVVDHRFVVVVTEGERYRQGKIVVTGDDRIDRTKLVHWLTTKQSPRSWRIRYEKTALSRPPDEGLALWTPGKNLNFTPQVKATFEAGVRRGLIEQGFPYASFELEYVPAAEPGLSDLQVKLQDAGSPGNVNEIEIHGLQRDTREQLLGYLGVAVGDRINAELLERIHEKLTDSCRYWSHEIVVQLGSQPVGRYPSTDTTVKLILLLEEFSFAPPLNKPLSEVDEVLRESAEWINHFPSEESPDLVFEKRFKLPSFAKDSLLVLPSAIAADGRIALNLQCKSLKTWRIDHSLIAHPLGLEVVDWHNNEKFASKFTNIAQAFVKIEASRNEDGEYAQRLRAGWAASNDDEAERDGPAVWKVRAEPVAVVYTAHRPDTTTRINGGVLTIDLPDSHIEIDAKTGGLIHLWFLDEEGHGTVSVRLERGGYDRIAEPLQKRAEVCTNRYSGDRPISSLIDFTIDQLRTQPYVESKDALRRTCQAAKLLQKFPTVQRLLASYDRAWLELQAKVSRTDEEPVKFFVTSTTPSEDDSIKQIIRANVAYYIPGLADGLFPRGSWPWTLTRELAFIFLADSSADEPSEYWNRMVGELARLERSQQLTPIAAWCCIDLTRRRPQVPMIATLGARVAACGLRQGTDESTAQDIQLLATGDHGWARTTQKLVGDFLMLPEADQQEFIAILPQPWAETASRLRQRLASNPNETPKEAMATVLLDRWRNGAGDAVEKRLRESSRAAVDIPATAEKPISASRTK